MHRSRSALVTFIACLAGLPAAVDAGPPYVTDDPVPTDYRHWEIYAGLQYENQCCNAVTDGLPFAELNYGAMPNVQVSITLPAGLDESGMARGYAYGVTEFGIKTRFAVESTIRPQMAFYPSIFVAPGPGSRVETFLPVWLQKSSGPWTAFGGGGVYLNAGPHGYSYGFAGAALERAISGATAIGIELYHQGAVAPGIPPIAAGNVGVTTQLGEYHAIVFSIGGSVSGKNAFSTYASYEFELGPSKAKQK